MGKKLNLMLFDICRQKYALNRVCLNKYTTNMILLHLIDTLVVTERSLVHVVCGNAVFTFPYACLSIKQKGNLRFICWTYEYIFLLKPNSLEFMFTVEHRNFSKFQ